ncbi:hypothetical protein [Paucihalobacter sp.]|uniref:hypothetical protein n=1 Tax=Paucihalobacter sp. TaxID=2850405 RepID=UPI002FE1D641
MSKGNEAKGSWNEGKRPEMGEEWLYINNPLEHVQKTNGLVDEKAKGTERTEQSVQKDNKSLSAERKSKVDKATEPKNGVMSWSVYEDSLEAKSKQHKNN